jgi:hypothetical protein
MIVVVRPMVAVRDMVNVCESVLDASGANRFASDLRISKGVGNPPNPDILVSGFLDCTGRSECVRGKVEVVAEMGMGSPW